METIHKPVMLQETIEALQIKPGGTYIDMTFGFGGHSREILKKLNKEGRLIGIEADKDVYDKASNLFKNHKNLSLYNCNNVDVGSFVLDKVDGIIFDLGTNIYQIKEGGRGFSFLKDEKLDMRLDVDNNPVTAAMILAQYSKEELEDIFFQVNEPFYRRIAKEIVETRKRQKIETTFQLVDLIKRVKRQRGKTNPATLAFMALRITVNKEYENLKIALRESLNLLKSGGRMVVITFHSGEDRIVKRYFQEEKKSARLLIINKKVIIPERKEIIENPLSRSAKIRVIEKV